MPQISPQPLPKRVYVVRHTEEPEDQYLLAYENADYVDPGDLVGVYDLVEVRRATLVLDPPLKAPKRKTR